MKEWVGMTIIFLIFFVIWGIFCWWVAGQEANAYFKATGKQVSQWDAMFLELRVQNQ